MDSLPGSPSGGPYIAAVTPDYFRTMGTSVRRGRGFGPGDIAGSQRVAVVNETMARLYWPDSDPIGKCLRIGPRKAPCTEVVGVVEDTRPGRVTEGGVVQYFIPLAQADSVLRWPVTALLVRTEGPPERLVGSVRREVQATSEIQSQSKLVCRLLLEKKKKHRCMHSIPIITQSEPAT